ncbi:MAG: hypothetical protein M3497_02940 [Gemmatimonadota bacterium]|nr:hypothetical protein [Gemmatimonadota bacterium]
MTPAEAWLRERLADAPPVLLDAMVAALPYHAESLPDALAGAALALYQQVLDGAGGREDALPLLAADALMTHAFEAQAELDTGGVARLAACWGAHGRLGELAGSTTGS